MGCKPKYSEEELYQEVIRIHNIRGYINLSLMKEETNFDANIEYIIKKYGGIKKISEKLGLNYKSGNKLDPEDIRKDFLRVYDEQGHIDSETYLKYGKYSLTPIKTEFGGINNLMKLCGIKVNMNKRYTKQEILDDIIAYIEKTGDKSSTGYRKNGSYSEIIITKTFGSWENVMNELGMDMICKKVGKEHILSEVKRVYNKYGFISRELIDRECDFKYQAIAYHFTVEQMCEILETNNIFCESKSVNAQLLFDILKELYPDVIDEHSWDWLRNDHTGKKMHVDFYIPSLNMAIEYDGEQHFRFIPHIHKTEEAFNESVYRDKLKDRLLEGHKIKLIRFDYSETIDIDNVVDKLYI